MIAEIGAALGAIKTSVDLLKTLNNVTQDEKVRSTVFDLQTELLSMQEKLFDANSRYEELSQRLEAAQKELDLKNRWEEEAKKYEIYHPAEGMTVYKLTAEHQTTQGDILACPNCFAEKKISFLNMPKVGYLNFVCHACKFEIQPKRIQLTSSDPFPGSKYVTFEDEWQS